MTKESSSAIGLIGRAGLHALLFNGVAILNILLNVLFLIICMLGISSSFCCGLLTFFSKLSLKILSGSLAVLLVLICVQIVCQDKSQERVDISLEQNSKLFYCGH